MYIIIVTLPCLAWLIKRSFTRWIGSGGEGTHLEDVSSGRRTQGLLRTSEGTFQDETRDTSRMEIESQFRMIGGLG
ncbi:hypothetical protein B7R74_01015 [Yersinia pseudotuberculosis]|nr:hypothetical protein B7R74_01015 [Yersinia pseudotuberculosis]